MKQRWICTPSDPIVGEQREELFIIAFLGCFFDGFSQAGVVGLFCENRVVQCILGRKVFEELTPAALAICFVVVLVKPFAANNDVAVLIKLRCRSWLEVRDG